MSNDRITETYMLTEAMKKAFTLPNSGNEGEDENVVEVLANISRDVRRIAEAHEALLELYRENEGS
jgi:hypothetical protein